MRCRLQVRSRSQAAQEEVDLDRPDFLPAGMPAAVAKATRNPYDARPSLPQRRMFRPAPPGVKGQEPEGAAAGKAGGEEQSQARGPPPPAAEPPQQTDAAPQDSPPQAAFGAPSAEMEGVLAPPVAPPAQVDDDLRLPQPGPNGQDVDDRQSPQQGPPVHAGPTVHDAASLRPEPRSVSASGVGNAATGARDGDHLHTAEAVEQRPEKDCDTPCSAAEADDAQAGAGDTQLRKELSEAHAAPRCPQVSDAAHEAAGTEDVAPDQLEQTPESVSLRSDTQQHPSDQ